MVYKAEYIWIDGTEPTPLLRSKTKILADGKTPPIWGFDGSSTNQADRRQRATACSSPSSPAPTRSAAATTSSCCARCMLTDGKPHPTNTRAAAAKVGQEVRQAGDDLRHRAGVHLPEADGTPLGFPQRRLPRPAGPVLLRRRRRTSRRPRDHRGAHPGVHRCRPDDRGHQRRGHARPVGVPDRRRRRAHGQRPPVRRPLAAPPHRRGLRRGRARSTPSPRRATGTAPARTPTSRPRRCARTTATVIEAACEAIGTKLDAPHQELRPRHREPPHRRPRDRPVQQVQLRRVQPRRLDPHPVAGATDGKGYAEDRRPNANCDPYTVTRLIIETVCGAA